VEQVRRAPHKEYYRRNYEGSYDRVGEASPKKQVHACSGPRHPEEVIAAVIKYQQMGLGKHQTHRRRMQDKRSDKTELR
jgi:hypothetical protein